MGDAAEERKRAKEAYIKALEAQRQKQPTDAGLPDAKQQSSSQNQPHSAAQKRELQLEERRKKFFERGSGGGATTNDQFEPQAPTQSFGYEKATAPPPNINFPSSEPIRPSDWKKNGFPSEFAYMKAMGQLDIPSSKIAVASAPFGNQPTLYDQMSFAQPSNGFGLPTNSFNQAALQPRPEKEAFSLNLGFNIGGADDKDAKKQKQAEYARALDQQSQFQPADNQRPSNAQRQPQHDTFNPGGGGGGGGLNIGAIDDKEAKKQKQADYARALDQQNHFQPADNQRATNAQRQPQNDTFNPTIGGGSGGGLNIGAVDDKEAKRQKQAEYARALDQQSQFQPADNQRATNAQRNHQQDIYNPTIGGGGGGGGLNIGAVDDKDAKKQKQADYARALDQQNHFQPADNQRATNAHRHPQHDAYNPMNGGGGLNIGAVDDKDAKKQKQAEYARALDNQQFGHGGRPGENRNAREAYGQGGGLSGLGLDPEDAAHLKRQQQQEYTRQLNMQAQYQPAAKLNKFGELEGARPQHQQAPSAARYGDITSIGQGDDRDASKRAKQAEYAMALQQQQMLHHMQQPAQDKYAEKRVAAASAVSGMKPSGGLEDGWVIGPLGLPVRKTLEVGNRGVQRAYVDHIQLNSPKKADQVGGMGGGGGMGGMPLDYNNFQQQPQRGYGYDSPPKLSMAQMGFPPGGIPAAALGGDIGGDPDDRVLKAKMLQADQARVLEMQMKANAERKEAEKKKLEEEDAKEMLRFEKQRIELQKQHEREVQEKKQKFDDDTKRDLERQMEQKRQEKEREQLKEKQRLMNEEARLQAEQEVIRRREEAEIQAEAVAAQRQKQQRLAAQQLEQRQADMQSEALQRQQQRHQVGSSVDSDYNSNNNNIFAQYGQGPAAAAAALKSPSRAPSRGGGARDGGAAPQSRGGTRDKSHLFDRAGSDDMWGLGGNKDGGGNGGYGRAEDPAPPSPHKRHVDKVLSDRLFGEQQADLFQPAEHRRPASQQASQKPQQRAARDWEASEETKTTAPAPLLLNLDNLKRNISEGAIVSGRRSARGASRGRSRGGAAEEEPQRYERDQAPAQFVDTSAPTIRRVAPVVQPLYNAPNDAPRQNAYQREQHRSKMSEDTHDQDDDDEEDFEPQFVPARGAVASQARQASPSPAPPAAFQRAAEPRGAAPAPSHVHNPVRRDHTQQENQYEPPQGLREQHHQRSSGGMRLDRTLDHDSKFMLPDGTFMQSLSKPTTPALTARWNRLSAADVGQGFQELLQRSDNRANSAGSSISMAAVLSPGKPRAAQDRHISTPSSGDTRDMIDEFKDTMQLLQADYPAAAAGRGGLSPPQHQSQHQQESKRPTSSGSTASDFDLERFTRRNERKWQLLKNINGATDAPDDDVLFSAVQDVHSRPSTAASTVGYSPAVRGLGGGGGHTNVKDGRRLDAGIGFREQANQPRPGSAELARNLTRLNNFKNVPQQRYEEPSYQQYGARPRSGDKTLAQSGVLSLAQRTDSRGGNKRYSHIEPSLDDPEFDNYSDYGL